ncbi:hypothetical protein JCM19037_616 [Geomicrobium sp. JCM 19037]|uniref:glutamic-type intramembrane protease PrsW n=1 Tax=unclassified Geomicrobium TaxID=2628951 RepID=UPI00045F31CF|nr:glutamic-type intramembrane protease PrsW [Geomicrobium sp. JCM 19037]GAK02385.1 hypothetical protein JCM19037_616 [Geomicrobium sp. JCM 19037]
MNVVALISVGSAPALALLTYFYLRNEYGSAGWRDVIRAFIIGMLIVFPIMVIQFALTEEGLLTSRLAETFLKSALLEEFFKWFFLIFTVYKFGQFTVKFDGIVYAVALSLGFATLENIFYLIGQGPDAVIGRALFPVSGHALFGVIMGYYLGSARYQVRGQRKKWLMYSLILPVVFHGIFNLVLTYSNNWMPFVLIPFMIFLWWLGLSKVKKANENSKQSV